MTWKDYFRYLVALLISLVVLVALTVSITRLELSELSSWSQLFNLVQTYTALLFASLLGHALPSWLRGRISLTLSSVLTAVIFTAVEMLRLHAENLGYSLGDVIGISVVTAIPVILIAHLLRLFVPPLRPHVDGKAVRYFGQKEPNRVEHQGVTDRA